MAYSRGVTYEDDMREMIRMPHDYLGPTRTSQAPHLPHTYNPQFMDPSVRTMRHLMSDDSAPLRNEQIDMSNQHSGYRYRNVQTGSNGRQQNLVSNNEVSRSMPYRNRDSYDDSVQKSSKLTPDSLRNEKQVIQPFITTITTTTETSNAPNSNDRNQSTSSSSASSMNPSNEAFPRLQKVSFTKPVKNDSQSTQTTEYTDKPQGYFNSTITEVTRAPYSPNKRSIGATDLDQAQAEVDKMSDDHQAIQQLARTLQEHSSVTTNEYKRLPSQSNGLRINTTITTTTTTGPSNAVLVDQTNKASKNNVSVLDAVADNPIGSTNQKQNKILRARSNSILSAIRNSEYVSLFKKSTKSKQSETTTNDNADNSSARKNGKVTESDSNSFKRAPLLNLSFKKKQDKENNKRNKMKSNNLTKNIEYQAIDALIGNPTSVQLPDSYLSKYNSPPSSPKMSPISSLKPTGNGKSTSQQEANVKNDAMYELIKIVNEIMLHATALTISSIKSQNEASKQAKPKTITEIVLQKYSTTNSNQSDTQIKPEAIKPHPNYQNVDEQRPSPGISSTPSSPPLNKVSSGQTNQQSNRHIEQTISHDRQVIRDNDRRSRLSEHEQNIILQNQPHLPTTVRREECEIRDKRTPKISELPSTASQDVRKSIENEQSLRSSSHQPRTHQHSSPHNVKLNLSPTTNDLEQSYAPNSSGYYDTDSTIYEYSPRYNAHDHVPIHANSYQNEHVTPQHACYHQQHLPGCIYHSCAQPVLHNSQHRLPEYDRQGHPRNYIEIFRDGNDEPSEVYTVPLSQALSADYPVSRYPEYDVVDRREKKVIPLSKSNLLNDKYKKEKVEKNNMPTSSPNLLNNQHEPERESDKKTGLPLSSPNLLEDQYKSEADKKHNLPVSSPNLLSDPDETIKNDTSKYQQSSSSANFHYPANEIQIIEENIPPSVPNTLYEKNIPVSSSFIYEPYYTSSNTLMRDNLYSDNHLSHSKSFDYRPLRAKLQRENTVTSTLLVDEWDNPERVLSTDNRRYRNMSSADEFY